MGRGPAPLRFLSLVVLVTVAVLCGSSPAFAETHLLGPGHEQEVLALFAPYTLGHEVENGQRLWGVAIERRHIRLTLRAPDGTDSTLMMRHPDDAPRGSPQTRSFALVHDPCSPDVEAAWQRLTGAITANDRGGFWESSAPVIEHSYGGWNLHQWFFVDGILFVVLLFVLALALAIRLLVGAPRWMGPALALIVGAGAVIRVVESPAVFLGAWPWTRLYPHARAVAEGFVLAAVSAHTGQEYFLTDVSFWTTFAYASLMPLVLFAHGTFLLRDARAGLAAAFAIAFLPQHIRFSRCEDGFIASLVLTSLAFALIHGWLRDRSRTARAVYIVLLPLVLYPGYLLRPLNILFIVVYAAALLVLHVETAPRWRRAVGLFVVLGVGLAALVVFFNDNAETASAVTSSPLAWLTTATRVAIDPRLLVLSDPTRTPPILIALALVGAVTLYQRGERRLLGFVSGWLGLFLVAHAVVVEPPMSPRYHLHLVVPFLLLAASAMPKVLAWWSDRRRRLVVLAGGASLVLAPWIHRGFVQDRGYAELREYEAVRASRDIVPQGCTVLEVVGGATAQELRFPRIGTIASPDLASQFTVVPVVLDDRSGQSQASLDALLERPPACLYLYEGLACSLFTRGDETYASECTNLRSRLDARTVLVGWGPNRFYDRKNQAERGVREERIPFRLSQARAGARADE